MCIRDRYKMFPPMFAVLDELMKKKVQGRHVFSLGSFGWSGGAQGDLDELVYRLKPNCTFIHPVECKGHPSDADLQLIEKST